MSKIPLNDNWLFTQSFSEDFLNGNAEGETVRLPHNCKDIPINYCDNNDYQMICGYRKTFDVPQEWLTKRVLVTFGAAGHYAKVYLNGELICEHHCGYTAFTVELTGKLFEGENVIAVCLDTHETLNQPPFGFVIDYLTYGGLYREVWLEVKEQSFIADAFVYPIHVSVSKGKKGADKWNLCAEVAVAEGALSESSKIKAVLFDGEQELVSGEWSVGEMPGFDRALPESLAISHDRCKKVMLEMAVENPKLWSVDSPKLYRIEIILSDNGNTLDIFSVNTGFRTAEFKTDGFYLNGKKLKIRGLNRHQCLPYAGYAMPKSLQCFDAEVLKNELGVNTVRTSHYPQSHHFIDHCDKLGLMAFTEIPGWQHMGDEDWQKQAVRNTDEMVAQYRNHPSIILWGVRINESQDNDGLYRQTNAVAHALDDTRKTSGVRNIRNSSLLEDVYSYNDFSYTGIEKVALEKKKKVTSDVKKPYIVSEFNGHMFPTKIYDDEEHCREHAMRHANVLKAMYGQDDISGCIGWCMFDYNTHMDFGSGDRVCYHGVMDMFRNPKPAAAVYASQSDNGAVCEVSSSMLIGEHPGGVIGDIYVFTNADSVKLYKNDSYVAEFFPDRETYPNMPHPPVKIDDLIGNLIAENEDFDSKTAAAIKECLTDAAQNGPEKLSIGTKLKLLKLMVRKGLTMDDAVRFYGKYVGNWGGAAPEYRFEAWKDGVMTASVKKAPPCKVNITAKASATKLIEGDTYDAALIRIIAVDENGNRLNYFNEPVTLTVTGAIELIGPDVSALRGGAGGALVRTVGEKGTGEIKITVPGYEPVIVKFSVESPC